LLLLMFGLSEVVNLGTLSIYPWLRVKHHLVEFMSLSSFLMLHVFIIVVINSLFLGWVSCLPYLLSMFLACLGVACCS
jgi:hypothetical protein